MPLSINSDLKLFVTDIILSARLYKNISIFSKTRMGKERPMAPTAVIEAGQISRNSKTKGFRLTADKAQALTAVKN